MSPGGLNNLLEKSNTVFVSRPLKNMYIAVKIKSKTTASRHERTPAATKNIASSFIKNLRFLFEDFFYIFF